MKIQADFRDLVITDSSEWVTFRSPGEELVVVTKPSGFEIKYQGVWYTLKDGGVVPIANIPVPVLTPVEDPDRLNKEWFSSDVSEPIPEVAPIASIADTVLELAESIIPLGDEQIIYFRQHNCHTTESMHFLADATDSEILDTLIKEYGVLRHWWRAGEDDPLK